MGACRIRGSAGMDLRYLAGHNKSCRDKRPESTNGGIHYISIDYVGLAYSLFTLWQYAEADDTLRHCVSINRPKTY